MILCHELITAAQNLAIDFFGPSWGDQTRGQAHNR